MMNSFFAALAPMSMTALGVALQQKDTNTTGADDATGQILVAMSPVAQAALSGQTGGGAIRRAMTATRDAAQAWLDANP